MKVANLPPLEERALPYPKIDGRPTPEERTAFTAARLDLQKWITRDFHKSMNPTVKLVACFLLECVNSEKLYCFPSYRMICEALSLGKEKTAQRALQTLRQRGWIFSWRLNRTSSNNYLFLKNEKVIAQIADYQTCMKDARDEDRRVREQTQMSGRKMASGTLLSGREQTQVSGKSFKVIHESFSSIEQDGYLIEANPYAAASRGDPSMQRYPVPIDGPEAERMLDDICAGRQNSDRVRETLMESLLAGMLTPRIAEKVLAEHEESRRAA
ncbi:helix-turn-helix domain-containing protein [Sinorhizobium fredii]|uniref:helix-turn-helix domain-containing protein n=1 Tax=Rhizobium fredii TaxID=380 RepID=UPI003516ECAA